MYKCWMCGKVGTTQWSSIKEKLYIGEYCDTPRRTYCEDCFEKAKQQLEEDNAEYVRLKKKLMFDRALHSLERQGLDMYEYREAIDAVEEFATEKPDKFDSSDEMMAAVILCYNRINAIYQYKVLRYQCDICIPEWKVIVEIDGDVHTSKRERDKYRDIEIIKELGEGWNIIRIKAELIEMKAENLVKAIKETMRQRIKDGKAVR